jgi:sugar-specific transcriptional regulator TrmB
MQEKLASLLSDVGFTGLEATVYLTLLREPCSTGYRIAQLIGKPAPNIYMALDSLRAKGAVMIDETSRTKTYSALPIAAYLEDKRRHLEEKQREFEQEVAGLETSTAEGGIFRLSSVDQVYARVRKMLEGARNAVLLDVFPGPMEQLRPDVAKAVKRGIHVFVKAYRPTRLKGTDMVCPDEGEAPDLKLWNGDWLNIAVDCCESLYSFLKPDGKGVHDAIWNRNHYLGMMNFTGLMFELMMTRIVNLLRQDKTRKEIGPELRELSSRYMAMALWRDAAPEGWMKEWRQDGPGKSPKPASRQARKRRSRRQKEKS